MEQSKRQHIRPLKQGSSKPTSNKSLEPQLNYTEGELYLNNGEEIREKFQAPLFFFNSFRGQRLTFGLLNGDMVTGLVGQQRWQFLRLDNVTVVNKSGRRALKWRMINTNRIDFVDSPEEGENQTANTT